MQYRNHRAGYTDRNGIGKIGGKSTGISLFLHMLGISFLLISPGKKQMSKNDIFTVHIIDIPVMPAPQVISSPSEKLPVEQPQIEKKATKEKHPAGEKEKMIEKQEPVRKEIPAFSAEKFRESLLAKTGITTGITTQKSTSPKTIESVKEPVKIEKIEGKTIETTGINISSLMIIPDWYLSLIHKKIKENWKTDNIIGQKAAIVSFRLYKDGRIENISLEKSSGNTRFDKSVLNAVISTKQIPPFPQEITHTYLDIIIEFKTEG
ncbi:MAG: TonB family protein [Candidatus Omnitrophica bacterium]|nr:TonB family protein [Candidatus Omnitrophota bacterium]